MDFSEKWGTDIEAAVELALADLKLPREEVDIIVLEEPSRGFFGIGSKLAKVRVQKKEYLLEAERAKEKEEKKAALIEKYSKKAENSRREGGRSGRVEDRNRKRRDRSEAPAANRAEGSEAKVDTASAGESGLSEGSAERRERSRRNRRGRHPERPAAAEETVSYVGDLEDFASSIVAREPEEDLTICEDHVALTFLKGVTKEMGLDLDIVVKQGKESIYVDITGKDSGTVIGKRGQTLDAIQYLTSLVVNKDRSKYVRVVVDAENYRAKREKTLEQLARRLAAKVEKNGKSLRLEPMNPYERKVIHATLQGDPAVVTRSEGQDPYRRVIIELK